MVLSTRTNCSFKCRACMELRCDCRSSNISETSKFEYSISYILRLMADASTENAQCGVLSAFRLSIKHRFEPCCTAHGRSCKTYYIRHWFWQPAFVPRWRWTRQVTGGWPMMSQLFG